MHLLFAVHLGELYRCFSDNGVLRLDVWPKIISYIIFKRIKHWHYSRIITIYLLTCLVIFLFIMVCLFLWWIYDIWFIIRQIIINESFNCVCSCDTFILIFSNMDFIKLNNSGDTFYVRSHIEELPSVLTIASSYIITFSNKIYNRTTPNCQTSPGLRWVTPLSTSGGDGASLVDPWWSIYSTLTRS